MIGSIKLTKGHKDKYWSHFIELPNRDYNIRQIRHSNGMNYISPFESEDDFKVLLVM